DLDDSHNGNPERAGMPWFYFARWAILRGETRFARTARRNRAVSNEAILTWSPSPVTNGTAHRDLPQPTTVQYAYYSIPLFWYALFDDESIIEVAHGDFSYHVLCKPTKDAVLLSRERWSRIRGLFDTSVEPQFLAWLDFLETGPGAHVICLTREWA